MDDIKNYYSLGDLHSVALVSKEASVDWLCLPHFDSPSIFAKLLDKNGGSFSVDVNGYKVSSSYLKNTAIVEFNFSVKGCGFKLLDFMVPVPKKTCDVHFFVRKFSGVKGISKITLIFDPKPDYASKKPNVIFSDHDLKDKSKNEDALLIHTPNKALVSHTCNGMKIEFELKVGEEAAVVLEYVSAGCTPQFGNQDFEKQVTKYWRQWVSKGKFTNFYKEKLIRSAITLKLLQFYPTGAIVAAPTTSLPETLGGSRNWDYRYVWIRDATFTLFGFYVLGYLEEAESFFNYIKSIVEKNSLKDFDISLMYTITGKKVPRERVLKQFDGYRKSKPVRVGNGAVDQFQLDVYGALIDAFYFVSKRNKGITSQYKELIMNLVNKISETWAMKDYGIWEVRSGPENFTYSKVMAWVGVNRAIRMADKLELTTGELDFCQVLERQIYDWIWKNCYDRKKKIFIQHPLSGAQDSTNFLFVLLQFLDKHDPLTKEIIKNTSNELVVKKALVYRYKTNDGLEGLEGAFVLCSYWLISAWAILEELDLALSLFKEFEKNLGDTGLMSEELDPENGNFLGNFPQAFSHLGFIMSAYYLDRYSRKFNQPLSGK